MDSNVGNKSTIRFLLFSNDKEDAEKETKLREATAKIEQAIAREKSLSELVDYNEPQDYVPNIDPANDNRSLYERLQEQRDKKKEALEESKKLSNYISKLDEDDVIYLNETAKRKRDEEIRNKLLANEERRRLEEKKVLEDEIKLKESLKKIVTSKTKASSSLKTRLSSLKIKTKAKMGPDTQTTQNEPEHSDGIIDGESGNKRSLDEGQNTKPNDKPEESLSKRQKRDDLNEEEGSSDRHDQKDENTKHNQACYCQVKNIAKTIGILPSMPQAGKFPDSSSSDDDLLEKNILPKLRRNRKH